MLVLGIDPGMATTGFGVLEVEGQDYKAIDFGCIRTSPRLEVTQRLVQVYQGLQNLIDTYSPVSVAVEELFFNKNVKTAMAVGQARGVILVAAALKGIDVVEYTPLQVKQGVVGYGRASKRQVQEMVKILLELEVIPKPDDAADALAVAICHAHALPLMAHMQRLGR
ncbi:MAG: crossover junction endodeoxyribonuclease RuvC [Firmicutes bacterium]|nr:crossover junction endodeoxyribonuclease RuvC [Bacillota bacterium]